MKSRGLSRTLYCPDPAADRVCPRPCAAPAVKGLLDENLNRRLARIQVSYDVFAASYKGWETVEAPPAVFCRDRHPYFLVLWKEEQAKARLMTLNIEISGALEAAIEAQAREQGLTVDRVARRVLEQALTPGAEGEEDSSAAAPGTTGEEKARAFVQWAKSHRDTPPLSDEAISRASLYPDRW